ncbi:MAG: DUF2309 domain-containing protein [Gammaproteobacteria bacterium]|nr:DUF2309 domain-containing protein [Gammaproteobacteria bacterium]
MTKIPAMNQSGTARAAGDATLLDRLRQAIDVACRRIAPSWPLDQSIAVDPHWGRTGSPAELVAARLAVLGGMRLLMPRVEFRRAWAEGRITADDLALAVAPAGPDAQACILALDVDPQVTRLPLVCDVFDAEDQAAHRMAWRHVITHQVSQTCAAYFDKDLADWHPSDKAGLYTHWRKSLAHDLGTRVLTGRPGVRRAAGTLPENPEALFALAARWLALDADNWANYLEALLISVNGWASWCAYRRWQAELEGGTDHHIEELLAIRLAWELVLLDGARDGETVCARWAQAWSACARRIQDARDTQRVDWAWQRAWEYGYQRRLTKLLAAPRSHLRLPQPSVQAVFCIDVRSEVIRRALESADPTVQTLGFAGFFGLPIAYTPAGTSARRPQLPGLLAPAIEVSDETGDAKDLEAAAHARRNRLADAARWQAASRWPMAAFDYVEAAGLGYAAKLWRLTAPKAHDAPADDLAGIPQRYRRLLRPTLLGLNSEERIHLAKQTLRAMSLTQDFAPLVLLVGHGSQSANNPYAAGLDCGACGGQTGEVNARALAGLLNDAAVRAGLLQSGISIPEKTWFIAALHNTTTDELVLFDKDRCPPEHESACTGLEQTLKGASAAARAERACALGLGALEHDPDALLVALRRRANDAAQTRPEWGLANNAAFVIADRTRTRGLDLKGRVFLHDYDAQADADGSVLELLMTAPMLVTHWINAQYNASTADPNHFGSGNKVLHNAVGLIGVFEGNGGDLRIGLSRQSVHDGERWMHEPMRLCVFVDAPRGRIDAIIAKHETVRRLLDNGWLHLFRLSGDRTEYYASQGWQPPPF